jgi:hypothetical protein
MNEEANRKLWEFAGFKLTDKRFHYEFTQKVPNWLYPDNEIHKQAPDFFDPEHGLGWLFKYVVPKIGSLLYIALFIVRNAKNEPQPIMWDAHIFTHEHFCTARATTEAEALANAILKWLEGEKR